MNKYITTFLLSIFSLAAGAQNYKSARVGLVKDGDNYSLSYPSTTIVVELLVEKETVTPGVYARYAQKYLTLRAPLIAQTTYTIIDAEVRATEGEFASTLKPKSSETIYSKLPADQYSSIILSADDAARDAASEIFNIRRQRRDIINGEAGEGYFGAGLHEAIKNLDAMEQEYMELFMGHRTVSQSIERYVFNPSEDVLRHVIARFDSKSGILPAADLTGSPVYMQFTPQGTPNTSAIESKKKDISSSSVVFRVAVPTECLLYNDSEIISSTVLSIYEFGKSVGVDASK